MTPELFNFCFAQATVGRVSCSRNKCTRFRGRANNYMRMRACTRACAHTHIEPNQIEIKQKPCLDDWTDLSYLNLPARIERKKKHKTNRSQVISNI